MTYKKNKPSLIAHILWLVLTLLVCIGISAQIFIGTSFFNLSASQKTFLIILAIGFFLAGILNFYNWPNRSKYIKIPVIVVISFGFSSLLLLFLQVAFFSKTVFVAVMMLTMVALLFLEKFKIITLILIILPLVVLTIILQNFDREPRQQIMRFFASKPVPQSNNAIVNTAYLSLKVKYYDNYLQQCIDNSNICNWPRNGGGIEELEDGYLVATGKGYLYYLALNNNEVMTAHKLKSSIPINDSEFTQSGESEYGLRVFRVTDILLKLEGKGLTLFASHHYWKKEQDCVVLRVSTLKTNIADFLSGNVADNWHTLFESKPCMPRSSGNRSKEFHGEESGGKMIWYQNNSILMTIGDHHFDGWNSTIIAAQNPNSDYGKTLLINTDTGLSKIFTLGHRNPQGLAKGLDGDIWETEHGPQGGDELNLLVQGENYGWPLVTYGTEYRQKSWPISINPDNHQGFSEPIYSWIPSIAISNLIVVKKDLFRRWKGDLLIASYSNSLQRARIRNGRVVTLEPIHLRRRNGRIRDLIEDSKGRIVLLFDTGSIVLVKPINNASSTLKDDKLSPLVRGELLFASCLGCHAASDGTNHKIGPDLAHIYNRPIASATGYNYSEGLKNISGSWSVKNLDSFLTNPQAFAAGNKMQINGIREASDRTALIQYMQSLGTN